MAKLMQLEASWEHFWHAFYISSQGIFDSLTPDPCGRVANLEVFGRKRGETGAACWQLCRQSVIFLRPITYIRTHFSNICIYKICVYFLTGFPARLLFCAFFVFPSLWQHISLHNFLADGTPYRYRSFSLSACLCLCRNACKWQQQHHEREKQATLKKLTRGKPQQTSNWQLSLGPPLSIY